MPTQCYNAGKEEIILRWQTETGDAQTQRVPVGGHRVVAVPPGGQVLASKVSNELSVYASIINKDGQPISFDDTGAQYGIAAAQQDSPSVAVPAAKKVRYSLPVMQYSNDPQPWRLPLYLLIGVLAVFLFLYLKKR
jgi:hypothetical protein